jgi:hypothetical protein
MDRQAWFRRVIPLLVIYNLGERRSTFAWRKEERREEKLGEDEGEEPASRANFFFLFRRAQADALLTTTGLKDGQGCRTRGATPLVLAYWRDDRRPRRWSCWGSAGVGMGWTCGL